MICPLTSFLSDVYNIPIVIFKDNTSWYILWGIIGMSHEHFAGRLKELREARNLTQQQLAELSGMQTNTIARLERGERQPSWETALALAGALGVRCEAFTAEPEGQEKAGRGRPRKEEQTAEPEKPKRGRGRPKKAES
jgi:transcriptional regulator with XRE-family HTH domain